MLLYTVVCVSAMLPYGMAAYMYTIVLNIQYMCIFAFTCQNLITYACRYGNLFNIDLGMAVSKE